MIARLIDLAEDAIAFGGTFVGVLLMLHVVDRLAYGLALRGLLP